MAGALIYAAVLEFRMPCLNSLKSGVKTLTNVLSGTDNNIFNAEDGRMIAVFIMDAVAALFYLSAAGAYARF